MPASPAVTQAVLAATTETLTERELPVPAVFFGIGAFIVFTLLLLITYSFRSVSHRQ